MKLKWFILLALITSALTPSDSHAKFFGPLVVGGATVAALGLTTLHIYSVDQLIGKEDKENTTYSGALILTSFFGPLGQKQFFKLLKFGIKNKIISAEKALEILEGLPGKTLAKYWGISHEALLMKAAIAGIHVKVTEGLNNLFEHLKDCFA